jgi:hypothetical protein
VNVLRRLRPAPLSAGFLLAILAAAILGAGAASGARADNQLYTTGLVNHVEADATTGQMTVELAGVDITTVTGPVDKAENDGFAISYNCTGCRAVAIALQVVFVAGEPSDSEPLPHPFPLSPAEQAQVNSIAQRLQADATSGDPAPDIDQQAQALRDELWADVANWVKLLQHDQRGASFAGADLAGFDLHGYDFSGADFSGANLSGAHLDGSNFSNANLSNANLEGADLHGVRLDGADLTGADTTGARGLPPHPGPPAPPPPPPPGTVHGPRR